MSMFAWMFDRQAELQQEVAQLKEQVESLRAKAFQAAADRDELAARMRSIVRIASHGLGERIHWLEGQPAKECNR
jgi:FtsZ-binding cell division protein ZapB